MYFCVLSYLILSFEMCTIEWNKPRFTVVQLLSHLATCVKNINDILISHLFSKKCVFVSSSHPTSENISSTNLTPASIFILLVFSLWSLNNMKTTAFRRCVQTLKRMTFDVIKIKTQLLAHFVVRIVASRLFVSSVSKDFSVVSP